MRALHHRRDDGASAVEYALLVAAIAAVIVGIVVVFGRITHDSINNSCETIKSGIAGTTSSCS